MISEVSLDMRKLSLLAAPVAVLALALAAPRIARLTRETPAAEPPLQAYDASFPVRGTSTDPEESFSVYLKSINGKPGLLSVNVALKDYEHKTDYPWKFVVSLPYDSSSEDGMPTPDDNGNLDAMEDIIHAELDGVTSLRYLGRITWNGSRELYYYLKATDKAEAGLNQLAASGKYRTFAFRTDYDPMWQATDHLFQRAR